MPKRKPKLKKHVLALLANVALLLLFAYLVGLVILLVLNPELIADLKSALALAAGLGPVVIIWASIRRRLERQLDRPRASISRGLRDFLVKEPLLLGMVYVFLAIGLVVSSYFWPYYSLVIEVTSGGAPLAVSSLRVAAGDIPFTSTGVPNVLRSKETFAWGDSVTVVVEADGFRRVERSVEWKGLPLRHLLTGQRLSIGLVGEMSELVVRGEPTHASIVVRLPDGEERSAANPTRLAVPTDGTVEIIATAGDGYVDWWTLIIVRGDTTIEFSLEQRPGYLVIRAFTEGQVEVHDMDVFVDGAVMPDMRLGETVEFPAGVYRVYLCRLRGDGTRVFAEPLSVTITPRDTTEDRRTVKLEERDDCNL